MLSGHDYNIEYEQEIMLALRSAWYIKMNGVKTYGGFDRPTNQQTDRQTKTDRHPLILGHQTGTKNDVIIHILPQGCD